VGDLAIVEARIRWTGALADAAHFAHHELLLLQRRLGRERARAAQAETQAGAGSSNV
jgi:hypothetical protein